MVVPFSKNRESLLLLSPRQRLCSPQRSARSPPTRRSMIDVLEDRILGTTQRDMAAGRDLDALLAPGVREAWGGVGTEARSVLYIIIDPKERS